MTGHRPDAPPVVGVLLAAGAGSRFTGDRHKLLARLPASSERPAETVAGRSIAHVVAALGAGLDHLVIVTGAADLSAVLADVTDERILTRHNPRWPDGQATSLAVGVDAADELGATVAIVGLADQPAVRPDTWIAIAAAATAAEATPITVATYDGRPRNPVAFHRSLWSELPRVGDGGARDLIRMRPDDVTPVPSSGSPDDIDTVEDHQRWLNS